MVDKTLNRSSHDESELEKYKYRRAKADRLIKLREIAGLSKKALADLSGVNPTTLTHWERLTGRTYGITDRAARQIIEVFIRQGIECSYEWLVFGEGSPPHQLEQDSKPVPNHFYFACSDASVSSAMERAKESLFVDNLFDFQVSDDSMLPQFAEGDIIIAMPIAEPHWPDLDGRPCIITTLRGQTYLRTLRGALSKEYVLVGTNSQSQHSPNIVVPKGIQQVAQIVIHCAYGQDHKGIY